MTTYDRRGFALPAAIGALVIMGILVTAGFFVARQELRIGVASKHANMAVNIAQAGANEVMANWDGYQLGARPVWSDTTVTGTMAGGTWEVTIWNANNFVYFLDVTGTVTEGGALWAGATRRIGIVTKMLFANINPPAALMTRGKTQVKGNSVVDGTDYTPPSWAALCTGFPTDDKPGILNNEADSVGTIGNGVINGNPNIAEDPSIVDSTFTNFGNMDWAGLTAMAQQEGMDLTPLGSNVNVGIEPDSTGPGVCDESLLTNWGDSIIGSACGNYFPLMYHAGPIMRLRGGGYGQGLLLVDGSLEIGGNFTFMGIIIIQGDLFTTGSSNTIYGGVMASNASWDNQQVSGTALIQSSQCAVMRAILNNPALSRSRPLAQRGWVDLTAVTN